MSSNPKALLDSYELYPKKSLGQNFMHDPNALEKIVSSAEVTSEDTVVEVGSGTGALTAKLAEKAHHVFSIEVDKRLQPILEDKFDDVPNVYFVFNDILKTDVSSLVGNTDFIVVANVPYYISSAIIWHFLEPHHRPKRMVMTMQYEVAERIMEKPDNMSLLTVAVQFYGIPTIVNKLSPAVFWPRPNIYSAVMRIDTHQTPIVDVPSAKAFFRVVKAGFSMKRKQLKNSLSGGLQIKSKVARDLLQQANIDPQRRAETLSLEEWGDLTRAVASAEIV
jgi:16S rRNA (adenine1518-N6/adenine1519-N6)-dimethyltransferase